MGEISGVPTADINNVDGFFTTQGGGSGITPNAMPAAGVTGTVLVGNGAITTNPQVTLDFNIGSLDSNRFTKIAARNDVGNVQIAIKANGTLWYWAAPDTDYMTWGTQDSTWRQYGTDTDWTDISSAEQCFSAVKGGDLMFTGRGSYRQRGDGSTSNAYTWIVVNSSLNWVVTSLGWRLHAALTDTGHVYTCGYNYSYMAGRGTTSGSSSTLTREKNNLTGCTHVASSMYRHLKITKDGNVYSTGRNNQSISGPLITSTSDINGPTLSYSGGDIVKMFKGNYYAYFGLTTTGQLRFAGEAGSRCRPDGSTTDMKGTAGMGLIDGGATGYTFYNWSQTGSTNQWPAVAIKNGQMTIGGGNLGYTLKQSLGYAANTTAWVNVGSATATTASVGNIHIVVSW